MDKNYVTNN